MEIDKKLNNDITAYCKENGLNKKDFINKLLKKAFNIEKYGEKPFHKPSKEEMPPQKVEETQEKQYEVPKEEVIEVKKTEETPKKGNEIPKEPENKEKNCIFGAGQEEEVQPVTKTNKRRLL